MSDDKELERELEREPERELSGSCLCGTIRYAVSGPWLRFLHCHCSRCRKASGGAHATNLFADAARFRWISGAENAQRFDLPTSERFAVQFCRTCGSRVPHLSKDGRNVLVPAGSLDAAPDITPQGRIFWGSRAPWSCEDALPKHEAGATR